MIFGGLLKKLIPGKAKQWLFDRAIDGVFGRVKKWLSQKFSSVLSSEKATPPEAPVKEKEIIGPRTKFNTGRLDWREIENQKPNKKKGK